MSAVTSGGALGQRIGNFVAPGIGGAIGRAAGRIAGSLYGHISGRGDYKITNTMVGASAPTFGSSTITESKREFLGYVKGSTLFEVTSYPINPGQSQTFPWLAAMASLFEEYRLHGVVFEFVSQSATAIGSTNTALGNVIMATEYDSANPPFSSSREMMATLFCNSGVPSANLLHAVECAPRSSVTNSCYVRSGPPITGTDIRLYDWGNFQFATEGMQAVSTIGALWVSYQITFSKPILGISGGFVPTQLFDLHGMSGGMMADPRSRGPPEGFFPLDFFNGGTSNILLPDARVGEVYGLNLVLYSGGGLVTGSLFPQNINVTTQLISASDTGVYRGCWTVFTVGPITIEGIAPGLQWTNSFLNGSQASVIVYRLNDYTFVDQTPDFDALVEDKKATPPDEPVHVLRTVKTGTARVRVDKTLQILSEMSKKCRVTSPDSPVLISSPAKAPQALGRRDAAGPPLR
jgi:hypothetical protein